MSRKKGSQAKSKASTGDDDIEILGEGKQNDEHADEVEEEDMYEDEEVYIVEAILGHRLTKKKKYEYLVKWEGYPSSSNTWEPETSFPEKNTVLAEYKLAKGLIKEAKKPAKPQVVTAPSKPSEKTQASKKASTPPAPQAEVPAAAPIVDAPKQNTVEKSPVSESEESDSNSSADAAMEDGKRKSSASPQEQDRGSEVSIVEKDPQAEEYARYEQELNLATQKYRPPQEPGLWCARYNTDVSSIGEVEWVDMSKQL